MRGIVEFSSSIITHLPSTSLPIDHLLVIEINLIIITGFWMHFHILVKAFSANKGQTSHHYLHPCQSPCPAPKYPYCMVCFTRCLLCERWVHRLVAVTIKEKVMQLNSSEIEMHACMTEQEESDDKSIETLGNERLRNRQWAGAKFLQVFLIFLINYEIQTMTTTVELVAATAEMILCERACLGLVQRKGRNILPAKSDLSRIRDTTCISFVIYHMRQNCILRITSSLMLFARPQYEHPSSVAPLECMPWLPQPSIHPRAPWSPPPKTFLTLLGDYLVPTLSSIPSMHAWYEGEGAGVANCWEMSGRACKHSGEE